MFFRSQDDWLSKRSRGSDLKTPENDSESPSLSDHFYFSYKLLSVIYLYLYTQHCFLIFLLSHILLSEIRPNSVSHPAAGFFHTGPDEIALGFRINIPIVFETFLQDRFQFGIFICFGGILPEKITEHDFIPIAGMTDMQMEDFIRKTLRCVAFA